MTILIKQTSQWPLFFEGVGRFFYLILFLLLFYFCKRVGALDREGRSTFAFTVLITCKAVKRINPGYDIIIYLGFRKFVYFVAIHDRVLDITNFDFLLISLKRKYQFHKTTKNHCCYHMIVAKTKTNVFGWTFKIRFIYQSVFPSRCIMGDGTILSSFFGDDIFFKVSL